jgi:hypothetical protein
MKKNLLRIGIGLGTVFVAVIFSQVASPPPQSLREFVPAGPLLYLEAKDFALLLARWRGSQEQQRWLRSADYKAFAQSHLFLRLTEAYNEYAAAADFAPDAAMLQSIAGSESAVAFYDIGKLEFLYLTRLSSSQAAETAPWRSRASFKPRKAGGTDFYVRADPSGRVVAFAIANGVLLLATREDLMAGVLELMAHTPRTKMIDEGWFARPIRAAGSAGDLRLVMDFGALANSPHFRSHWIQHNVSLVRQYTSGISDLFMGAGAIREERLFLRAAPALAESAEDVQPLAESLRLVPDDVGFYRGWSSPAPDEVSALLAAKLLDPSAARPDRSPNVAPSAPNVAAAVGSEAYLDTRIDEPVYTDTGGQFLPEPLQRLLGTEKLTAVLQVDETHPAANGVFMGASRALVVVRQSAWDGAAVREALVAAVENLWTISRLGAEWAETNRGNVRYFALNGLVPLAVSVEGNRMIVANSPPLIERLLARTNSPLPSNVGRYAAGFRHERERHNYAVWMSQLNMVRSPANQSGAEPIDFLSQNLVSLSETLARIRSASIQVTAQGEAMKQTVVYELAP